MEGHLFATALEHRDAVPSVHRAARVRRTHAAARRRAVGLVPPARRDARRRGGRSVRQGRQAARASLSWGPARRAARRERASTRAVPFRAADGAAQPEPGDADYYDVSFSGLKTAVLHAVRGSDDLEPTARRSRAAFQDAMSIRSSRRRRAPRAQSARARRARRRRRVQPRARRRDAHARCRRGVQVSRRRRVSRRTTRR